MLCANVLYSDPVTYIPIFTHLNKYVKFPLYNDILIIQIALLVAEIRSVYHQAETQNSV